MKLSTVHEKNHYRLEQTERGTWKFSVIENPVRGPFGWEGGLITSSWYHLSELLCHIRQAYPDVYDFFSQLEVHDE